MCTVSVLTSSCLVFLDAVLFHLDVDLVDHEEPSYAPICLAQFLSTASAATIQEPFFSPPAAVLTAGPEHTDDNFHPCLYLEEKKLL